MRGGNAGKYARGGLGGVDWIIPPQAYQLFGKSDGTTTGYRRNRVYVAGSIGNYVRPAGGQALFNDRVIAYPAWLGVDCSVSSYVVRRGSGNTTGNFKLAIYANLGLGDFYPGLKLWEGANKTAPATLNTTVTETVAGVSVNAGTLLWFTLWGDSAAANMSVRGFNGTSEGGWMFGGFPPEMLAQSEVTAGYAYIFGWQYTYAYVAGATLPTTFPRGSESEIYSHINGTPNNALVALMYSLAIG